MKRFLGISAFLILLFPGVCFASGYIMANYGIGGEVDEPSVGVEIGGIFLTSLHPSGGAVSFGLGVSVADTDEDPPSGLEPPIGFTPVYSKEYNDGYEQEIDAVFGAELIPALFGVIGVGYSMQETTIISAGSDPLPLYETGSSDDNNTTFMFGIRYAIEGLNLGVGFHTRRGVLAGVGIAF